MVSAEQLSTLFEYHDGKLYWKFREDMRKGTNTRFAGKEAGCEDVWGYKTVTYTINGKKYRQLVHRVVYALHHNNWPPLIDHIDRDRTNNHIENLRPASKKLNAINSKRNKDNKSGFRGVSWNKLSNRWEAYIKNDNGKIHLGLFHCIGKAIKVRENAEKFYWAYA